MNGGNQRRFIDVKPGDRLDFSGPVSVTAQLKSGKSTRLMVEAQADVRIEQIPGEPPRVAKPEE